MFIPAMDCSPSSSNGWAVSLKHENPHASASLERSIVPFTQRARLIAEFSEISAECSEKDWNGFRADPVTSEAYAAATKLIAHLPPDVASPTVGAIPEGLYSFEWYRDPKRMVMVVPNINNGVDYAIRRGDEVLHGSAPFFGALPDTILSQIRDLV